MAESADSEHTGWISIFLSIRLFRYPNGGFVGLNSLFGFFRIPFLTSFRKLSE